MQEAIARYRLASWPPDLLIEIPSNTCEAHEFYKARQVIAAGRHWTRRALDRWDSEWGKR
jgi:NTE family protein